MGVRGRWCASLASWMKAHLWKTGEGTAHGKGPLPGPYGALSMNRRLQHLRARAPGRQPEGHGPSLGPDGAVRWESAPSWLRSRFLLQETDFLHHRLNAS